MNYDIRYLPLAEEDLDALAAYLSCFYPGTASRVLNEIDKRISYLREHPLTYEEYENDRFYHRMVVLQYLVFYHVDELAKSVDIHRILRGCINVEEHLQ